MEVVPMGEVLEMTKEPQFTWLLFGLAAMVGFVLLLCSDLMDRWLQQRRELKKWIHWNGKA